MAPMLHMFLCESKGNVRHTKHEKICFSTQTYLLLHHKDKTESICFTFLCHVLCQLLRLQVSFLFFVQNLETQRLCLHT